MPRRYYSSTAQRTTLASPLSSGATTMIVSGTTGFPGTRPYTLVIDPDTINEEIVTVTAASGTTLTVTRGEDGTSAVAHDLGATVWHGFTGRDLGEPQAHMDSSSGVHGRTGEVVGDTDAQTLSNKTMSGADNTFTDIPQTAVTSLVPDLASKAPINSPTFTGNPVLPASTTLGDLSPTEISYLNGVTSNVQAQLDAKAPSNNPTFTGSVSLPTTTAIGSVSGTEISRLAGVSANIQAQLDSITGGGVSVPTGGDQYDILVKLSPDDYDMAWKPLSFLAYVPGISNDAIAPDGSITGGDSTGTYTVGTWTYRWHRFTTTGITSSLDVTHAVIGDILIIGGGGGGGNSFSYYGGGGGAGALYEGPYAFGLGSHNCIVGAGGTANNNGENTRFDDIICLGGGAGGNSQTNSMMDPGSDGGSGGGGNGRGTAAGLALGGSIDGGVTYTTTNFRCSNGTPSGTQYGGGAGGAGVGFVSNILGSPTTFAIGGAPGSAPGSGNDGSGAAGGQFGGGGGTGRPGTVIVRYRIA